MKRPTHPILLLLLALTALVAFGAFASSPSEPRPADRPPLVLYSPEVVDPAPTAAEQFAGAIDRLRAAAREELRGLTARYRQVHTRAERTIIERQVQRCKLQLELDVLQTQAFFLREAGRHADADRVDEAVAIVRAREAKILEADSPDTAPAKGEVSP